MGSIGRGFMNQLLGSMKISVKLPFMVRVDSVGAIFMASNITTMSYTKHLDVRHKHVMNLWKI